MRKLLIVLGFALGLFDGFAVIWDIAWGFEQRINWAANSYLMTAAIACFVGALALQKRRP